MHAASNWNCHTRSLSVNSRTVVMISRSVWMHSRTVCQMVSRNARIVSRREELRKRMSLKHCAGCVTLNISFLTSFSEFQNSLSDLQEHVSQFQNCLSLFSRHARTVSRMLEWFGDTNYGRVCLEHTAQAAQNWTFHSRRLAVISGEVSVNSRHVLMHPRTVTVLNDSDKCWNYS